jgi:L-asparaginase II
MSAALYLVRHGDADQFCSDQQIGGDLMTVVAVATRSGMVESEFHGHIVVTNPDASIRSTIGDPGRIFYPRSANKLMQAATMARLGLKLPPRLAALSASSHSGEEFHQFGAQEILDSVQCSPDDLDNTPALPYDDEIARDVLRAGGSPTRLAQNCSGKHAAMIATCVLNGWPLDGYLALDHPLQKPSPTIFRR